MSNDILLRLGELRYPPHDQSADPYADACEDAREEIVALRARIAELQATILSPLDAQTKALHQRVAQLEAERASLLEAAQKAREQAARLELKHGRLSRSEGAGLSGNKTEVPK